ncbi:MAG: LPS export ABC transporter periplasmic protein LptC [Sphingomonadaceae bacterium]|nr:LPS export ABC transporter periplasmic protein LptC [Sphingomonadaceae bacterium]
MVAAAPALTPRQLAMLPGTEHDRRVGLAKKLFPAAAIGVLLAIIILTFSQSNELSFTVSRERVQPANERSKSVGSVYRGLDQQGRAFMVRADSAIQRSAAVPAIDLDRISATMQLTGGTAEVTAPSGRMLIDRDVLVANGPVRADKAGYVVTGGPVALNLREGTLTSDRPVAGRMPLGPFRAGGMQADVKAETLVLTNHVRLHVENGAAN